MTYNTRETSLRTGEPVELYEFRHGPNFYRYTSSDADVVFEGDAYQARTINRTAIEATQELARNPINLTTDPDLPLLALFRFAPPSEVIQVVVRRFHRGDAEAATIWMGRILNVGRRGLAAEIRCESVYSSIKRPGLRRMYQKACPHVLYSAQCGVNREAYRVTLPVVNVAGLNVTFGDLSAYPPTYFVGGYIEWSPSVGIVERRSVRNQGNPTVAVNFPPVRLTPGTSVDLYPGCAHNLTACDTFGNRDNYGGMPYIPTKNPFDGTPIF
jgi:uncharacterized phage protein (TIGR02218 family)